MKTIIFSLIAIVVVVVMVVAAYMIAWHNATHNELDTIRGEFDKILETLGPSSRFRQGLERAKTIIDVMDDDFNGNYVETVKENEDSINENSGILMVN